MLERLRRQRGAPRVLTLAQLVEEYLDQHQAEPETTEKLRWLLTKSVDAFGSYELHELQSREIAAWRMRIPAGHRFEATQALRQVLARAIEWRLIDFNAAKTGVANPVPTRREMRPFETWDELRLLADVIGPRHGPVVLFAAATGLRPCEWLALEHRDIDLQRRAVHVRRNYVHGRVKTTKTVGSLRTVPLQDIAMHALQQMPSGGPNDLLIPAPDGGYFDLHNFRTRVWNPGQGEALVHPRRRIYDLRHTFATFALAAGISTFDLSRYMGTSLTMIDRHYGHLAKDARAHAIHLLDTHANKSVDAGGRRVDVAGA